MMPTSIVNGAVFTPNPTPSGTVVAFDGDRIVSVGPSGAEAAPPGEVIDAADCTVVPGFVDLHLHGGGGHEFIDAASEAIETALRAHARHGTTACLPTVETAAVDRMLRAIEALAAARCREPFGPMIAGMYLEGPFLNPEMAGAQEPSAICSPDVGLLRELLGAGNGLVRVVTFAPELRGTDALIDAILEASAVPAIGHTAASAAETARAIDRGAVYATHLFSAMSGFAHREGGAATALLADDRVTCEVICDGVHIEPMALKVIVRAKRPERIVLVTDAVALLEAADEELHLFGRPVHVERGAARLPDGRLAGSILTMERATKNLSTFTDVGFTSALACATTQPAAAIGASEHLGAIAPGARADFALLDENGEVRCTVVAGRTVWNRQDE